MGRGLSSSVLAGGSAIVVACCALACGGAPLDPRAQTAAAVLLGPGRPIGTSPDAGVPAEPATHPRFQLVQGHPGVSLPAASAGGAEPPAAGDDETAPAPSGGGRFRCRSEDGVSDVIVASSRGRAQTLCEQMNGVGCRCEPVRTAP